MNKHIHRLVLDRRRGMLVPAAETARSAGKAASGSSRSPSVTVSALLAASIAAASGLSPQAQAAPGLQRSASVNVTTTLPQTVTPHNQLAPLANRNWVQTGAGLGTATMSVDGKLVAQPSGNPTPDGALMLIRQTGLKAILNWDSFNIGTGKAVEFRQDSSSASTLNYIWSADPTVVRGSIKSSSGDDGKGAGGEVILQNTNGVIFANGARVDTGRFVATALTLTQDTFLKGLRNVTDASVVFGGDAESSKGFILLEQGAEIRTAAGGDVLLIAPRVLNEGRIETPSGQTVMAAGQKVYMATSQDATQRGLVVAVSPFAADGTDDLNTVEQAKAQTYQTTDSTGALVNHINAVVAEKGSINLVGLSIKQNGLLSATNAVQGQNGAIYLQAMSGVAGEPINVPGSSTTTAKIRAAAGGGSAVLGANSVTQVNPDGATSTQIDKVNFVKAKVAISGGQILMQSGAKVQAQSGIVSVVASATQDSAHSPVASSTNIKTQASSLPDASRVVIESGATIDVSGVMNYMLPMSSNYGEAKLFSIELASSPLQRKGVLYQKSITFDIRQPVAVADVSGALANIGRTAQELSTTGGSVDIRSDGVLATQAGSTINFAGGSISYADGIKTISLLRKGDTYVDVNHAKANVVYDELVQVRSLRKELGYTDGKNAGAATFVAPLTSLKGQLNGSVVYGARQRNDGMEGASAVPQAGTVTIGRASREDSAVATAASDYANTKIVFNAPTTGAAAPGSWLLDPLNGSIDGAVSQVNLSPDLFMSGGIGSLNLYADKIEFAAGPQLDLGTKGSLAAYASAIDFNGHVRAASGSIVLAAQHGKVTLGDQAQLTVAGAWTNDRTNGVNSTPLALDGGSVKLLASDSVVTAQGSQVDASAGAWGNLAGTVKTGSAGSIKLTTNSDLTGDLSGDKLLFKTASPLPSSELDLHGQLQAYGFSTGGTLVLQGNHVGIGQGLNRGLNLDAASFFSTGGFGDITVKSFGDFKVAAGSQVSAKLSNAVLNTTAKNQASAQTVSPVVSYAPLVNASQRKAVNITLQAMRPMAAVGDGASVDIGKDALIQTEAGGQIKLMATNSVNVAGHLVAPGGNIALTINGVRGVTSLDASNMDDPVGKLDPAQGIWLTDTALLDVHGISNTYLDALGRNVGTVLGGGTVSFTANRGYVVAQKGSVIDVSGASADNVLLPGQSVTQTVNQAAGTVNLSTPEGFALEGTINAHGPVGADMGGTLNASVTVGARALPLNYPTDARQILVTTSDDTPASVASAKPGVSLPALLGNGRGTLSTKVWQDAGFAEFNLAADDNIVFSGQVDLQAARAIKLDTHAVRGMDGAHVRLSAPVVTLGNVNRNVGAETLKAFDTSATASAGGNPMLEVDAGLIDLAGTFGLQGWNKVGLLATRDNNNGSTRTDGEIRLRGKASANDVSLKGSLNFAGELTLQAGQIYADTMSTYTLQGLVGSNSVLTTLLPEGGSTSAKPLSAFGNLTINATDINHNGQIVQPFGTIALNASGTLTLGANSLLSVSGEGVTVPVGTTVNQASWYYSGVGAAEGAKDSSGTSDLSTSLASLPVSKQITLKGAKQSVDKLARLSAAGGGDVQAWEFISGVGGLSDYLAGKNLYAVIPSYQYDFAPFDAEVMSGNTAQGSSAPAVGKQVVLTSAAGGLAAGTYTLLPARYALLSGAYLVSVASDAGKSTLRGAQVNEDGSVVTTGYFTNAGSTTAGVSGQRLLVQPMATYMAKAQYATTSINSMLQTQASRVGNARPVLPEDAGRIAVESANALAMQAQVDLAAKVAGAHAGQFDLVAPKIAVVSGDAQASTALSDGYTTVDASVLNGMNAASVLLGGKRKVTGTDTSVTVVATDTRIEATQTPLELNELIAVGKNTVIVDQGVQLKATGTVDGSTRTLSVVGDAAVLAVSSGIGSSVQHTGITGAKGTLTIQPGVEINAPGVLMDASGKLSLDPSVSFKNMASFGVGARQLALGSPNDGSPLPLDVTVIEGSLLSSLKSLASLSLRSYSSIDLYGDQQFTLVAQADGSPTMQRLLLDAPTVRGMNGGTSAFTAQQVVLQNTSGQSPLATLTGSGSIAITAKPLLSPLATGGLTVGDGAQSWGFGSVNLASTGDLIWSGAGAFSTLSDLTLQAARVTAGNLANKTISSGGTLTVLAAQADSHTMGEQLGQAGKLAFDARTILQQGYIDVSSGQLSFTASGTAADTDSLIFDTGSKTLAQGFAQQTAPDNTFYGNGGSIKAHAAKGNIVVKGALDVSAAAGGGDAGTLSLVADGELAGKGGLVTLGDTAALTGAAAKGLGGQFVLDASGVRHTGQADSTNDMDGLLGKLAQGGFQREIDLRVRVGDLVANQGVSAHRLLMSADQGSIALNGQIDARAEDGGVVQVMALHDLSLNGSIDARSTRSGANGGDVLLGSDMGLVTVGTGAMVDASSVDDTAAAISDGSGHGRIILRARRDDGNAVQPVKVAIQSDPAKALKAGEVTVEAVKVYGENTAYTSLVAGAGSGSKLGQDTITNDLAGFSGAADAARLSLFGSAASANQHVRAGYEIRTASSLTIADAWNLQTAAHSGIAWDPINLTIRAGGGLNVHGSVSDGFDVATAYGDSGPALIQANDGASYRFVAGADLTAANLLATSSNVNAGTLKIGGDQAAGGTVLRTTSGSIELAAAGDIRLVGGSTKPAGSTSWVERTDNDPAGDNLPASVYVAGKLTKVNAVSVLDQYVNTPFALADAPLTSQFTGKGGRLDVQAGRDVINVVQARQVTGSWLVRSMGGLYYYVGPDFDQQELFTYVPQFNPNSGDPKADPNNYIVYPSRITGWWSDFAAYNGSFGSFGGSSLNLTAGRNVENVQAAVPTSARQTGLFGVQEDGATPQIDTTKIAIENGGNLSVRAGGDIKGGTYFVARGNGLLDAAGSITNGSATQVNNDAKHTQDGATAPILSLMDGNWALQANGAVTLAGVNNPTIMPVTSNDRPVAMSFLSYSPDAAVNIVSTGSGVTWDQFIPSDSLGATLLGKSSLGSDQTKLQAILPPVMRMAALGGDLKLNLQQPGLLLAPSALGDLDLYARGDVVFKGGPVTVSDVSPNRVPSLSNPIVGEALGIDIQPAGPVDEGKVLLLAPNESAVATTRVHDAIHAGAPQTASIVAGGTINDIGAGLISIPMAATIEAGMDIVNLNYRGTQFADSDVTRIAAGRNLIAPTLQTPGVNQASAVAIKLGGAGLLDVSAGRQLNLGDSAGVQTFGKESSANLPVEGASIKVSAGTASTLDWNVFDARYLTGADGYASATSAVTHADSLIAFVASQMKLDASSLSLKQAQAYFLAMKPATQNQFVKGVLSAEFGSAYLTSNGDTATLSNWLTRFKTALRVDDATLASLAADDPVLAIYNKAVTDAFGNTKPSASAVGYYAGWQQAVAKSLGHTVAEIEAAGSSSALYASYQTALSTFSGLVYERYRDAVLMGEVRRAGTLTAVIAQKSQRTPLFDLAFAAADKAGVGESLTSVGDLSLTNSTVQTRTGGDVNLFAPGGDINVGLPRDALAPSLFTRGVLTYAGGDINAFVSKEFQVNSSRVITVGTGDLTVWSSDGNIDSGKGANTDVTIPPPRLVVAQDGSVSFVSDAVTSGKGLQAAETAYLVAPRGEVRAQDAFVKAGANLIVSAQAILAPAGNLQAASISGVTAAPVAPTLAAPSTPLTTDATAAGVASAQGGNDKPKDRKGMLTVDLLGLGDAPGAGPIEDESDDGKPCAKDDPRAKCQNKGK